jgi:hypothetical protein
VCKRLQIASHKYKIKEKRDALEWYSSLTGKKSKNAVVNRTISLGGWELLQVKDL